MQEKDMMNDYLEGLNSSLAGYASIIAQTENQQLRSTIQQLRNQDEIRQYNVFIKAKEKGYYKPAAQATQNEITTVKNELMQG